LNLFPTFFDPSHGVVEPEWALGGAKTGGCVACHSSSAKNPMTGQPMDPATYSPYSVGFFDGTKDLLKNGMMQAADYDCEGPMLVGIFDNPANGGNGDGKLSCIEPMTGMPPCGTDPAMDAYAAGYTSGGVLNGEVGVCKKFVADGLMKAFGVQNSTPGAAMDGIEFMQMMAIKGGATTADPEGCNPMLRLFGYADGGSSTTMPPTGTGCAQSDYFSRVEIRQHFQKNLQQSKFNPAVGGGNWINPITNAVGTVPTTMNRVFGIVAVGKNPSNPNHANKFDIGATCYNPMDGSTFACPDGGYVQTTVSETQLLGYASSYQTCLMSLVLNPGSCGDAPVALIAMGIDPVNPLQVNFNAGGSTNADSYTWTFGDGGTGSGVTVSHTYAAAGDYIVTLKVTGPSGPENTTTSLVTLSQNVVAKMAYQLDPVVERKVNFDGTVSQNETTYAWNFGDGSPVDPNGITSHTYAASGTYVVTLTVTDGNGNSNTTSGQVQVDKLKPVARIMMQLDPADPRKVNYDGTASLYEYSYSWDFGDGSPADTNGITSHTYAPGTYYPKLTVTGITGIPNTATTRIVIK
jgi:PKD repeat protein